MKSQFRKRTFLNKEVKRMNDIKQTNLSPIMNKEQILENVYNSSTVSDKDKKTIEDILTSKKSGIKNSILNEKIDSIIRKYRPQFFSS